jgi:hypothetical protein
MNLSFTYEAAPRGSKFSKVVEDARQKRRDDATLRLARIQNGAEPGYVKPGKNGKK